jgi:hypothetical protein
MIASGLASVVMVERPTIGYEVRPTRSRFRRGLSRIRGPVTTWLSNRWNWRNRRRVRVEVGLLEAMVVPVASMPGEIEPSIRWAAELFDRLPFSVVLQYGYGMGEAVVIAASMAPDRIVLLVDAMREFTDEELLGIPGRVDDKLRSAVTSRNDLMSVVRDIIRAHPKQEAAALQRL